jgi:hypothetical protein
VRRFELRLLTAANFQQQGRRRRVRRQQRGQLGGIDELARARQSGGWA